MSIILTDNSLPNPGSLATILVVEDDDDVRRFVVMGLQQEGYSVVIASDGNQALDKFRENPEQIDLVLTDVLMPNRSGLELADELVRIRPAVRLVFMSGYTGNSVPHLTGLPVGARLLEKPFGLDQLIEIVKAALQESLRV